MKGFYLQLAMRLIWKHSQAWHQPTGMKENFQGRAHLEPCQPQLPFSKTKDWSPLKHIQSFSSISLLAWATSLTAQSAPLYKSEKDRAGLTIATPATFQAEVRKIRLENGLEVFLISDPETRQSGAALAVGVGSWDDPQNRPGMAHFVEHMLFFQGSKNTQKRRIYPVSR